MWTQKGLSKQSFSVGATAPVPEIPSGYVHIAYMALNLISLWNSQGLLAVDILYHKKPLLRTYLSIMDAGGLSFHVYYSK